MENFKKLRNHYKEFHYNKYSIQETEKEIYIEYEFEIPNLATFKPNIKIPKKNFKIKKIQDAKVQNMVFHIGLIELISYWKCTCSPKIIIKCGFLDESQKRWWKKLYFNGLGELFYTNNINTNFNDFVNIECENKFNVEYENDNNTYTGYIVPIGGGKDSIVTLETLNLNKNSDFCLIVNPKKVTLECAKISGFQDNNIIEIYRCIDKNLIDLNQKGFINGHTPFSAMLAFLSYFVAYLLGKKYIALSNENSANESNVANKNINHQYSKSYEFECDFRNYCKKYLNTPIEYFSFLRPLNELQIAKIFAKKEQYHTTFRSCNVGSKESSWIWCCNCSKCLFAFIILSPYLYKEKIINIFGENLYEKKSLLKTFIELTGNGDNKPFDCVGTFEEVNFAISKTIENLGNNHLPYLLKYYTDNFNLVDTNIDITKRYNLENNLTAEQNSCLRKEVFNCD